MKTDGERSSLLTVAALFYLVLAVAGVVWMGLRRGQLGLELFLDMNGWPLDIAYGLGAGCALAAVWALARRVVAEASRAERLLAEVLGEMTTSEAVSLAVLSAVAEEFFFRGAVQDAWGILPAAALFTLLHVGPGRDYRLWTLFAAIAGLALGALVALRGSLASAIVAHMVVNGIGLLRLRRVVSR